jgi:hypothetical protein
VRALDNEMQQKPWSKSPERQQALSQALTPPVADDALAGRVPFEFGAHGEVEDPDAVRYLSLF